MRRPVNSMWKKKKPERQHDAVPETDRITKKGIRGSKGEIKYERLRDRKRLYGIC